MYRDWVKSYKNITEYIQPVPLQVLFGKIPKTLKGTYYKVSPGEFTKYDTTVKHPFDGDGYISSFKFFNSAVHYQSRFVNTFHRNIETSLKKRIFTGAFGTKGLIPILKNPANTSIIEWNNELIVFCESGIPYRIDPITLETIGTISEFQEGISIRTPYEYVNKFLYKIGIIGDVIGAHPKKINGRLIFYSIEFKGNDSSIFFYELDDKLTIVNKTEYQVEGHLYFIHDFIVTEDYYIFIQHSLKMDLSKLKDGLVNTLVEDETKKANILHVVARPHTNKITYKKEVLPGFITHHIDINDNQSKDKVELYSVWYPKVISWNEMEHIHRANLYYSYISLPDMNIYQKVIFNEWIEFPVYDNKKNIFALMAHNGNTQGSLVRIDATDFKKYDIWYASKRSFFSEPIVADNYILLTCYNAILDKSFLYIFNKDIVHGPEAICLLPEPTPIGLHSCWSDKI